MRNVPSFDAVQSVLLNLIEKGLIWEARHGSCQACGTVDDVYETHRDLIDAARQVLVCHTCLTATVMSIE